LISFPCVPLKETRKNHTCFTKKKTKSWSTRPELWIGLIIVLSQHKNKNDYYYSFKTRFEGRSKTKSRSQVTLIIDSGQHKDKKNYYHSFKTQLQSRSGARRGSRVELTIDLG